MDSRERLTRDRAERPNPRGGTDKRRRHGSIGRAATRSAGAALLCLVLAAGQGFGACVYTICPKNTSVPGPATGLPPMTFDRTVQVTTAPGCPWTASSGAGWITVVSGASGNGPGTVDLEIVNDSFFPRSASITIAGQSYTVMQGGPDTVCFDGIDPASDSYGASGGSGSVDMTAEHGCSWSAVANDAWITITGIDGYGVCGEDSTDGGPGTVHYSVDSNPGAGSRVGTITIGGQTHTVNQEALPLIPQQTFSLELLHGGFEDPGGAPHTDQAPLRPNVCGVWQGDDTAVRPGSHQGVVPRSGSNMLQIVRTGPDPGGAIAGQVWQLICLDAYTNEIAKGLVWAQAEFYVNRVAFDTETDTQFACKLTSHAGLPADFPTEYNNFGVLVVEDLFSDGYQSTWERVAVPPVKLPSNTTYLALQVTAKEDVFNDSGDPEFDGHYVDDAEVWLTWPTGVSGLSIGEGMHTIALTDLRVAATCSVERTENLVSNRWTQVDQFVVSCGETNRMIVPSTDNSAFYRARYPGP